MTKGLIPEWAPQDAVLLAWPDETMDWADNLAEIRSCYLLMVRALLDYVPVILLAQDTTSVPLRGDYPHRLTVQEMPLNDTWVRDYAPLSVISDRGERAVVDYAFNAWGLKFAADRDNQVASKLPIFTKDIKRITRHDYVLEGGAVESNGEGLILSTSSVLLDPNRNLGRGEASVHTLTEPIREALHADRVDMLEVSPLEGDDTDGHIDTLARFCDGETIVYASCSDEEHPDYNTLRKLDEELHRLYGERYRLVALPTPEVKRDTDGSTMPASYANFLITNRIVLAPTYRDRADDEALSTLRDLFPGRKVVPVDAIPLIRQHGSIHCATMQFPEGFIDEEYK